MKYIAIGLCLLLSYPITRCTNNIRSKKINQKADFPTTEVSYGELIDKITILEIKMEKITDPNKLRNVKNELESLMNTFYIYVEETKEIQKLKDDLKLVNTQLWNIEDTIRVKEAAQEFDDEFIKLARSVYFTNDKRCAIKRKINMICGSRLIEEKQYVEYVK